MTYTHSRIFFALYALAYLCAPAIASDPVLIRFQYFEARDCKLRVLVRSAPGGRIPTVDYSKTPPEIRIPPEGGSYRVIVQDRGLELTWPGLLAQEYELLESDEPNGPWERIGIYLGSPEVRVNVPVLGPRKYFIVRLK